MRPELRKAGRLASAQAEEFRRLPFDEDQPTAAAQRLPDAGGEPFPLDGSERQERRAGVEHGDVEGIVLDREFAAGRPA